MFGTFTVLCMVRVVRLPSYFPSSLKIGRIVRSAAATVAEIRPVALYLLLIFLVFALAGMHLWQGRLGPGGPEAQWKDRLHFDTFGSAMLTLFVVWTGDGWVVPMHAAMRHNPVLSAAYFLGFFALTFWVVLNMGVAIVIRNFAVRPEWVGLAPVAGAAAGRGRGRWQQLAHARRVFRLTQQWQELAAQHAGYRLRRVRERWIADRTRRAEDALADYNVAPPPPRATSAKAPEPDGPRSGPSNSVDAAARRLSSRRSVDRASKAWPETPFALSLPPSSPATDASKLLSTHASGPAPGDPSPDPPAPDPSGCWARHAHRLLGARAAFNMWLLPYDAPAARRLRAWLGSGAFRALSSGVALLCVVCAMYESPAEAEPHRKRPAEPMAVAGNWLTPIWFTLELALRGLAHGLYRPDAPRRPGYLQDRWGCAELFLVVTVWLSSAEPLGALRALRPFFLVSRVRHMRVVLAGLRGSLTTLCTLLLFALLILLLFALLGMASFLGRWSRCTDARATGRAVGAVPCTGVYWTEAGVLAGRAWTLLPHSFETIGQAVLTLVEVLVLVLGVVRAHARTASLLPACRRLQR